MGSVWNIQWLRRFFRRRMNPVPVDKAHMWKRRLSLTYMFISWNAFGLVIYMMATGRSDWAKYYGYKSESEGNISPGRQWARTLNIENAKVLKLSGLSLVEEDTGEGDKPEKE
ncbi:uncharacterized protein LOC124168038 [Ischnura elegans]|uniref:uncharacterized protein LOC124168038 n=1 Tax=Ischnura elegans TaxID=197161 RepID=UPI001ED8BBC3|nr:uncharacterized protein LOC124168038 [Ischnura elegans]